MRKWRIMFSTSTIASSTKTPMTNDSANNEIILRLNPNKYIPKKVGITDNGNATAATKVARILRKNKNTTTTASNPPSISMRNDA